MVGRRLTITEVKRTMMPIAVSANFKVLAETRSDQKSRMCSYVFEDETSRAH